MEQHIQSFAGTPAGSILIALGIGVYAFPYAVKYLVKEAEEQAIPWALALGREFYDEYTGTVGAALKKLKEEQWHEANPDITQTDIDIPEGIQEYFKRVGLPASSHLVAFKDKETLSVFQHSGEWNLYGTRNINKQEYWLVVPKGIKVYYTIENKVYDPDTYEEKCSPQPSWWADDPDCYKIVKDRLLLTPSVWP